MGARPPAQKKKGSAFWALPLPLLQVEDQKSKAADRMKVRGEPTVAKVPVVIQ